VILYIYILFTVAPIPVVTAPNNQTVGQPLTLQCSVTAVGGITNRVDIIWSRDGTELNRTNNISPTMMGSSYTDTYTISLLRTTDNNGIYECTVAINANPVVMATGNVTLEVMGECFLYSIVT